MLGWEPTEVHEHEYDAAGRLVRTVVTRESEWDDGERDNMLALTEYDAGICECGMHKSIADTDPDMEIVRRRCPACVALAQNVRIIHAEDEKALKALGEKVPPEAIRPDDGRYLSLRMKPPASVALAAE